MKRDRPPLREGNSNSPLPLEWFATPSSDETPPDEMPARALRSRTRKTTLVYVIQLVSWWKARFANHPDGGFPREVFRTRAAAEARCEHLNREHRLDCETQWRRNSPLASPPRGTVMQQGEEGYSEPWPEDELRLLVLGDYVQDLGLPPPVTSDVAGWEDWWRTTRPQMESGQIEAIWRFLDREPAYRVSEIEFEE